MKIKTLIYSHGLKREDLFFEELERLGLDLRYLVINENIGSSDLTSDSSKPQIVHPIYDQRRGIFPPFIEEKTFIRNDVIDQADLEFFQPYFFDLMTMCSRMDADGFTFSFEQRWALVKKLIIGWMAVIEELEIEKVIINHIPHFPSEYILFLLCQRLKIPVMMRVEISGSKNIYYSTSIDQKHEPILRKMKFVEKSDVSPENEKYFENLQKNYNDGAPWEIKLQNSFRKDQKNRLKSLLLLIKKLPRLVPKLLQNTKLTMKTKKLALASPKNGFNYLQLLWYFVGARHKIIKNEKVYKSMVQTPDFSEKYILFSSSYQPERTTCPDAGYFADLLLTLDLLAKSIPSDWKVYYKEHPTSFLVPNSHYFFRGHMFRSKEFFESIGMNPNVKMIDVHADNYKLIDNAVAVATATGTSAWEAAIRGKVGIIFGNSWFEGCDGVFRVRTQKELKDLIEKIKNGYQADLPSLKKFREAFLQLTENCPVADQGSMTPEVFASSYARFIMQSSSELKSLGLI